jgi:hypothetical protein
MKRTVLVLLAGWVTLGVIPAGLGEETRDPTLGISPKISTLGVGGDLTLRFGKYMNGRVGVNYWHHEMSVQLDEADVEGTLEWNTFPLLLDWHPAGGGFRVSFGGVVNNNKVKISADPRQPITLEGTDYWIESLDGEITFPQVAPYFGIGYGNAVLEDSVLHFACEFGVMFQGALRAKAKATANLPPALMAELDRDLQQEVDDFEKDASAYQYYPVIALGFSIGF